MNNTSSPLKQRLICFVVTAGFAVGCVGAANAQSGDHEPYSRFVSGVTSYVASKGKDAVADAIADGAVKAGGAFAVVGGTYKLLDQYLAVADKAADHDAEDPFCGAQVVVLNRAVEAMKAAKSEGVDTNSPEFKAIKAQFQEAAQALNRVAPERTNELAVADESPAVYSFLMTCKYLRYSTAEVGIDDVIEDSIAAGLHTLGLPEQAANAVTKFIPVEAAIHWALAQGKHGWEKLRQRAELAQTTERKRIAAAELHAIGSASLHHSFDDAISSMYEQALREAGPSGPTRAERASPSLAVSNIRLAVARQSVFQPQFMAVARQPAPSLAHAILVQQPLPQVVRDPLVTAIKTDNVTIHTDPTYTDAVCYPAAGSKDDSPSTPEAPTIALPSTINWDGR
jgi:hypothetical protein